MAITYNTVAANLGYIFTTTGAGTVFSANQTANVAFNYFANNAVVNDAIYFSGPSANNGKLSDLNLTVGTPMAGTGITLVWEYYCNTTTSWRTCHNLTDGSNGFTTSGVVKVVFPIQANSYYVTLNGISSYSWVRCRITALTTITNGGANATTRITCSDGTVNISGYTDGSPCTWQIVYDWIVANAPGIGATQIAKSVFKFDNCMFNIASTLRSNSETVFIGNGAWGPMINIAFLWSGTKVGTNGWSNTSDYFFCFTAPNNFLTTATTTRVYGGRWDFFKNTVDGITTLSPAGYLGVGSGEWIGAYLKNSGYFSSALMDRCTVDGGLITAATVAVYPTNLQIANAGANIWSIYGISVDIASVNYSLPTVAVITSTAMYGPQGNIVNIINPNPGLPDQTGSVKTIGRALGVLTNFVQVLFYDANATTYTDYTTAASNVTADDVPLGANVGDILYLYPVNTTEYTRQYSLEFTITAQANNFVYALEYYKASVWTDMGLAFGDLTNNLSQTGTLYVPTDSSWSTATINGVAAKWLRLRVVSAGTGTPKATKIQFRPQGGIWNGGVVNEKYSYDLSVTDTSLAALQSATVYLKDVTGTVTGPLSTAANGSITQQNLTKKFVSFDKNVSETHFNFKDTVLNPYTLIIAKYGYVPLTTSKTISKASADSIQLAVDTHIAVNAATAGAYTGITINGATNTVTLTVTHTLQEIYDYAQWWKSQTANIGYPTPVTTADGTNFLSSYNLVINGVTLTGNGTFNIAAQTLTLIGVGKSYVSITHSGGVYGIRTLTLSGLVTGSDIAILNAGTSTVRVLVDANSGSTYAHEYTDTGAMVDISIYKPGYKDTHVLNYTLSTQAAALPISQQIDRAYVA